MTPDRAPLSVPGRLRLAFQVVKETVTGWVEDDAPRHGAALAYYAVFSLAPVLVVAISIAGLLYGEDTARAEVTARLYELLGAQGASAIEGLLDRALLSGSGVVSTIVGVVTLLVGASTLFIQLRASFNHIWRVTPPPGAGLKVLLCRQGLGLLMVLVVGAILIASLVLNTVVHVAADAIAPIVSLSPEALGVTWSLVSFGLVTVLIAVLFKMLPDVTVPWGHVWLGAGITAALFTLGRWGIAKYLEVAGVASAYGAAGSLVAFLVWVYWSAQILLLGAEFTRVYAGVRGPRPPRT